ncbi:MAG: dockerin type I repeat-containing protein, partial [Euryarchaeota archaeon]|nr:dockerin type I repeat-containing protein [Euryarchaeota archaeon]
MNGGTNLKIIGISALLIAALLSGVVFVSLVSGDGSKISDGAINDTELAWRGDLQDLYHRYNVTESDVLFVKNDRPHYLNRTILDGDTVVIATETGEPLCELKEGEDCEIAISTEDQCMIWAQGKSLSTKDLVRHRNTLTDIFFKRSGEKTSNRYVGVFEDEKASIDAKLVAYGFRIFPDGVTEEYRGYCDQDFSGYKEAMDKTERWFSASDEETCGKRAFASDKGVFADSYQDWVLIHVYSNTYSCSPHGSYSTTCECFWDNTETDDSQDYFMMRTKFNIVPGIYENMDHFPDWRNYRGYVRHTWKYYDYPGTREMYDAQPTDERGETSVGITLSAINAALTWVTSIPTYLLDDQSDLGTDVALWKEKFSPYSSTCGESPFSVTPGSTMMCSQNEARSGDWIGLAFFDTKPVWIIYGPEFSKEYSPGYVGGPVSVRWTGSEYTGTDGMEGDVNGNGHVTIGDAMLIAQHTTHIITLDADQLKRADTTDEGSVTIGDAMHISQYTVDPTGSLG